MSRDKILALAALAASDGTPEHEAATAAKILAKMIHANPDVIANGATLPEGASAIDPLVGYAIRQGFDVAADLLRDMFARRPRRTVTKCGAVLDGKTGLDTSFFCSLESGHAGPHKSAFGHAWATPPGAPPKQPKRADDERWAKPGPGPRKARAPRTPRSRA